MNVDMPTIQHELRVALKLQAENHSVALVDQSSSHTFAEVSSAAFAFESLCRDHGWSGGARVGLVLDKSSNTVLLLLGLILAGACPAFIDPRTLAQEVQHRVSIAGLTGLVCEEERHQELRRTMEHCRSLDDLVNQTVPIATSDPFPRSPHDDAMILFTSGSTGTPKGALLSQRAVALHARGVIEHTGLSQDDSLLHVMPLFHTNGVNNQILAAVIAGSAITLTKRFKPEDAVDTLRNGQHTILTGVPTMLIRMLPFVRKEDSFGRLRMIRCGSAPIKTSQVDDIEKSFNVPVVLSYGMSEATCTTTINPPDATRAGTVGTVLRDQSIRIAKPRTTDALPSNQEGEVLIGGGALMTSYVGEDSSSPVQNGWLRTGDLGTIDHDGYLTITGRLKDTIVRGGENISPAMIEHAITRHPSVQDCSVVAQAHHDLGEVPVAYIALTDGSADEVVSGIHTMLRQSLTRNMHPTAIYVLPQLPVNAVGKIDRAKLSHLVNSDTTN